MQVLSAFKLKVQHMTAIERLCTFILDEMSLHLGLAVNVPKGFIEGFEDLGIHSLKELDPNVKIINPDGNLPGNSALVFMARGIISPWPRDLLI